MRKIKMRWYSFSSNKSRLIVRRINSPELGALQTGVGRAGGIYLPVFPLGSVGDTAGKISVRCKEEPPGWGRGWSQGEGCAERGTQMMFVGHGGRLRGNSHLLHVLGICPLSSPPCPPPQTACPTPSQVTWHRLLPFFLQGVSL